MINWTELGTAVLCSCLAGIHVYDLSTVRCANFYSVMKQTSKSGPQPTMEGEIMDKLPASLLLRQSSSEVPLTLISKVLQ